MKHLGKISVDEASTGYYDDPNWVGLVASGPEGEIVLNIPTFKASTVAGSLLHSAQQSAKRLPEPADVALGIGASLTALQHPVQVVGAQILAGDHPCLLLDIGVGCMRFELLPEGYAQLCATVANAAKGQGGLM